MTGDSPDDSSSLCTECGLCCSGALFDYGTLCDDEFASASKAGLDCREIERQTIFIQPCTRLSGACCEVYDQRPRTCRTFRCQTLKALEAGEIDHAEAEERVSRARDAVASTLQALPAGSSIVDARQMRREAGNAQAAEQLLAPPMAMMALGMLDLILDQHFRIPGQRLVMPREET